jgi:DHA3 family macrolide efflux protein-like MFS transporter
MSAQKTTGMRTFFLVWGGQLISLVGSGIGSFALGVWVYEVTGSATRFALAPFAGALTGLLLLPVSGAASDRWDRRLLMMVSDSVGAVLTLVATWLFYVDRLQVWHVYLLVVGIAGAATVQIPAFSAAITTLVPGRQLARASGMVQSARATAQVLGPVSAGLLIGWVGYHGVLAIDFASFLFGIGTLLAVRFPRPARSAEEDGEPADSRRGVWRDAIFGWAYIRARPGLLRLLGVFASTNFALGMLTVLLTPLVLSFSTVAGLGTVQGAAASGLLVGGVVLSIWGGPQRRIPAILLALAFQGVVLFLAALRPSLVLVGTAGFCFTLAAPVMSGLSQAIWQAKVHQDRQGRVFAIRLMIAMSAMPFAYLLAGPLADHVFEPLLMPGGALADSVGRWLGVGPGRGIGLLFIVLGGMLLVLAGVAARSARLRRLETEIPDAGLVSGDALEERASAEARGEDRDAAPSPDPGAVS